MKSDKVESKYGFQPIVADTAQLLILGTLPGEKSLQIQQYYGHPRNAFWAIMSALFNIPCDTDYENRKRVLIAHGLAVWDVVQACQRIGSLDANIDRKSLTVNHFADFFVAYPGIKTVRGFNSEVQFQSSCGLTQLVAEKYVMWGFIVKRFSWPMVKFIHH